jgi:hypothetical protein
MQYGVAFGLFLIVLLVSFSFGNKNGDAFWFWVGILALSGVIYFGREFIFFNSNFWDVGKHLVHWEYPSGDLLIITPWGLMKYETEPPKASFSVKFEGFKWEFDNAKELAENLIEGSGDPLTALLPSINFSTTTNRIDDYIPFSFFDTVELTFSDVGKGVLVIQIEKRNDGAKYRLVYPLPENRISIKPEYWLFADRLQSKTTPVRGVFIRTEADSADSAP